MGRRKHFKTMKREGKRNIFRDSTDLYDWFCQYKDYLKEESKKYWKKTYFVGKDGERKEVESVIPYTVSGFNAWSFRNGRGHVKQYLYLCDDSHNKYKDACQQINDEIREQQILGGLLGFYNANITQRLNHLSDHKDITTDGKKISSIDIKIIKDDEED